MSTSYAKEEFRRPIVAALAAIGLTAAAIAATTSPAAAGTGVTFELTGGTLTVSEPATMDLGETSADSGGVLIKSLGNVTVTDDRDLYVASWTATASSTDFTNTSEPAAPAIPVSAASYVAVPVVGFVPDTGFAAAALTPVPAVSLSLAGKTVVTGLSTGDNMGQWNPTLELTVPANSFAGAYSGTITHSVA